MKSPVVFGYKAFLFALSTILVGAILIGLQKYEAEILAYFPFLPPYGVLLLSFIILLLFAISVWIRERQFEVLKYEFVNIVTHKFRTPLTYVNWALENLKKRQTTEERAESVRQIENASNRLIELMDILIGMAKVDDGSSYVFKALYIREIIEETMKLYYDQIKEKNIKFNIEMAQNMPLIAVDLRRIAFVINVLLDNALKYTPRGGFIDMKVGLHHGKHIRFSITDNGIGIKRRDLHHVFSKFFRSHEATGAHTEGMGLGLYISKNIIKRHGGHIWAESDGNNQGSTFIFEIPVKHGL